MSAGVEVLRCRVGGDASRPADAVRVVTLPDGRLGFPLPWDSDLCRAVEAEGRVLLEPGSRTGTATVVRSGRWYAEVLDRARHTERPGGGRLRLRHHDAVVLIQPDRT